jgi:hypothetical protein
MGSEIATACREFMDEWFKACRFSVPEDDSAGREREEEINLSTSKREGNGNRPELRQLREGSPRPFSVFCLTLKGQER